MRRGEILTLRENPPKIDHGRAMASVAAGAHTGDFEQDRIESVTLLRTVSRFSARLNRNLQGYAAAAGFCLLPDFWASATHAALAVVVCGGIQFLAPELVDAGSSGHQAARWPPRADYAARPHGGRRQERCAPGRNILASNERPTHAFSSEIRRPPLPIMTAISRS